MPFADFNAFEKDTAILNSDRLILNSKDDSIFILSKKTVGTSAAESVHFDIGPKGSSDKKYMFIVNSPSIQLGLPSNGINEPIAKADSTINFINDLILALNAFSDSLANATALGVGASKLPEISIAAKLLKLKLDRFKAFYGSSDSPIKSKISKTI
jgi:hypothetical protein